MNTNPELFNLENELGKPKQVNLNKPKAIALGSFDGVHKGHATLIVNLNKYPDLEKHVICVEKPFSKVFLFTRAEISKKIRDLVPGAEISFLKLNKEIANKTYLEFNKFLKQIKTDTTIVGTNFCYGKGRQGSVDTLKKDFRVDVQQLVCEKKQVISSTLIKNLQKVGRFYLVKRLIGDPVCYKLKQKNTRFELGKNKVLPLAGRYLCQDNLKQVFRVNLRENRLVLLNPKVKLGKEIYFLKKLK